MKILNPGFGSPQRGKIRRAKFRNLDVPFPMLTDSYKIGHGQMYPKGTQKLSSYFEARETGAESEVQFFGLQYLIKRHLEGEVVTKESLDQSELLLNQHFGGALTFDREKWEQLRRDYGGRLPIRIRAVAEGLAIPNRNVLFDVENTDEKYHWLVSPVETILLHTWYASEIATRGLKIRRFLTQKVKNTSDADPNSLVPFLRHDFGFRGTSSLESAAFGGMAHLVNFWGTDTLPAMIAARDFYGAKNASAFSVPASEHSVATAEGQAGEEAYFDRMLRLFPKGVVSIVADSYDVERFIRKYVAERKDQILQRHENGDGPLDRVVIRLDSKRFAGDTNPQQVLWAYRELAKIFPTTQNSKGCTVLHPAIGLLSGDGNTDEDILETFNLLEKNKFSVENLVIGQGGGLLQSPNRDDSQFSFKCSAQMRNGVWVPVQKKTSDPSKSSKAGRLELQQVLEDSVEREADLKSATRQNVWRTVCESDPEFGKFPNQLREVFRDGELLIDQTFQEIRDRAVAQI